MKEVVGKQGVRIQINGLTNGVASNGGVLVGPPPKGDLRKEGRGARPSSHPLYKSSSPSHCLSFHVCFSPQFVRLTTTSPSFECDSASVQVLVAQRLGHVYQGRRLCVPPRHARR